VMCRDIVEVPGGSQALQRTEVVEVAVADDEKESQRLDTAFAHARPRSSGVGRDDNGPREGLAASTAGAERPGSRVVARPAEAFARSS
jgi:hypothetical protein